MSTYSNLSQDVSEALNLKDKGDIESATNSLEQISQTQPHNLWAKYYLALIYINSDKLELAKELINNLLQNNQGFVASYYAMAIINDIEGNIDEAINMYKMAINIFPEYQDANYRIGACISKKTRI